MAEVDKNYGTYQPLAGFLQSRGSKITTERAGQDWFLSRQTELKSWEDFEIQFQKMFTVTKSVMELYKRMSNRVQKRSTIFPD